MNQPFNAIKKEVAEIEKIDKEIDSLEKFYKIISHADSKIDNIKWHIIGQTEINNLHLEAVSVGVTALVNARKGRKQELLDHFNSKYETRRL